MHELQELVVVATVLLQLALGAAWCTVTRGPPVIPHGNGYHIWILHYDTPAGSMQVLATSTQNACASASATFKKITTVLHCVKIL